MRALTSPPVACYLQVSKRMPETAITSKPSETCTSSVPSRSLHTARGGSGKGIYLRISGHFETSLHTGAHSSLPPLRARSYSAGLHGRRFPPGTGAGPGTRREQWAQAHGGRRQQRRHRRHKLVYSLSDRAALRPLPLPLIVLLQDPVPGSATAVM